MKKAGSAKGFTLIECVLAVCIGSMILLVIGRFFQAGNQFAARLKKDVKILESSCRVGEIIGEDIRNIRKRTAGLTSGKRGWSGSEKRFSFITNSNQLAWDRPCPYFAREVCYMLEEAGSENLLIRLSRPLSRKNGWEEKAGLADGIQKLVFLYQIHGQWMHACGPESPVEAIQIALVYSGAGGEETRTYSWVYYTGSELGFDRRSFRENKLEKG